MRRRVEASGDTGFFVAEGVLTVRRLLASGRSVRSVLVTEKTLAELAPDLTGCDAPVYVAGPDVLRRVVGFDLHRGAVAAADRFPLPSPQELVAGARLVAVLEGVNDHENIGGIFRNAAAFGVDALLLDPTSADPLYRRAVRVSMGHVLTVPFARLAPWPDGLGVLRRAGLTVVALTPGLDAAPITSFTPPAGRGVALLLGAEGPGLSHAALAAADVHLRIPMAAGVDSLNIASAAAVALHRLGTV